MSQAVHCNNGGYQAAAWQMANKMRLIVQRNELSCIPQSFFSGPAVAGAGNSIPLLPPFGEIDYMPLRLRGEFGGEYDLQ